MAKIDTTTIQGYAEMTAEEKLAALEAFEYEDNAAELERMKSAVSKANGEAAEWKRKHNAKLTEDEQAAAAAKEELDTMRAELDALRRDKAISEYTANFVGLGYDAKLAADTAKALAEGKLDKVFANQKAFQEARDKAIKADIAGGMQRPSGGDAGKKYSSVDEIMSIEDSAERHSAIMENVDMFNVNV